MHMWDDLQTCLYLQTFTYFQNIFQTSLLRTGPLYGSLRTWSGESRQSSTLASGDEADESGSDFEGSDNGESSVSGSHRVSGNPGLNETSQQIQSTLNYSSDALWAKGPSTTRDYLLKDKENIGDEKTR